MAERGVGPVHVDGRWSARSDASILIAVVCCLSGGAGEAPGEPRPVGAAVQEPAGRAATAIPHLGLPRCLSDCPRGRDWLECACRLV